MIPSFLCFIFLVLYLFFFDIKNLYTRHVCAFFNRETHLSNQPHESHHKMPSIKSRTEKALPTCLPLQTFIYFLNFFRLSTYLYITPLPFTAVIDVILMMREGVFILCC